MVPVELLGRTAFPPIGETPYPLAMPGYGFYWFVLSREADVPTWHIATPDPLPELITIVFQAGWRNIAEGAGGRDLAQQALPGFLANQRWFAAKDHRIAGVRLAFSAVLPGDGEGYLVTEIEVSLAGAEPQLYLLPLSIAWGEQNLAPGAALLPYTVAKVRRGSKVGALYDAAGGGRFRACRGAPPAPGNRRQRLLRGAALPCGPGAGRGRAHGRAGGSAPRRRAEQQLRADR